ncbi:arylsulfatase A-like enzyme [Anseongella ginsenosidimutans]|uniref:Arylsulfatase A-like enzyme n=1 Tax=Anseongella ginsenosidimutans TaxID=496056 RepID=A0A4R3KQI9_9SPHI|nr:sulfatase [Anseongella ginsenosidimutans]QEC52563.1 sulfatase [Anseongella ginsenosidimutans]TCS86479.1 arylsulfatase A-like enzyme [Anseongella ginsenosidimutans]
MKKIILLFAGVLLSPLVQAQQKPNIVVFMVDDMGWMDTSVPFADSVMPLNKRYHTPNMERLAREGMKFSNAYSTPVCTPTRISLITGMNAAHHGVTNWTHPLKDHPTDRRDSLFGPAPWNYNGLSPVEGIPHTVHATPLPQLLKEAGYFTVHAGKAHWGPAGTPGANPRNLGFTVNIAGNSIGHPQSYLGTENYGNIPGKTSFNAVQDLVQYYGSETFLTEALTLEALKALEHPVTRQEPFFLYLAHYAVHVPLMADKRYYQKYIDAGLSKKEAMYASMIAAMDQSLGDVMDYLEENDLAENTILLFMSDNGGLSMAPPMGGEQHTQNLPLRAGKGSVYEGGIREPMLVKWPGVTRPGSVSDQYVIIEDFFPTLLEMAQVKDYETVQTIDGKSFVPFLKNTGRCPDTSKALIWHFPNKWQPRDGPGINYKSAIRQGEWKLIYDMRSGKTELYHLRSDIGETTDLSAKYPGKSEALSRLLSRQLRLWNAPMPTVKSTGEPVPFP